MHPSRKVWVMAGMELNWRRVLYSQGNEGISSHLSKRNRHHPTHYHHPMKKGVRRSFDYVQGTANYVSTEMNYMYTNAQASNISKMPEPFRTAVQNSRLWKWERSQKHLETTGCWPSLFPKDYTQDVSFTIWCGHEDGHRLADFFGAKLEISS